MCEQCDRARRSTAPRWRGRYDRAALRRACAELGVKRPVKIECREDPAIRPDRPLPREGIHYGEQSYDGDRHIVKVTRNLPTDTADHTMLHELAHCAQSEREGFVRNRIRYWRADTLYGYHHNPYEVEANAVADRLAPRHSIMRGGEREADR